MKRTRAVVKQEVKEHIESRGGRYSDWYVGIAADPKDRLFNDHQVDRKFGKWIYRECLSSASARLVERYFIDTLGTQGGPGGGDDDTAWVYAYRITPTTVEG